MNADQNPTSEAKPLFWDNPQLELDDELRWILSRIPFRCRSIADLLRRAGFQCAFKCEDEQAVALHWMLGQYALHGARNWRAEAEKELKLLRQKLDEVSHGIAPVADSRCSA